MRNSYIIILLLLNLFQISNKNYFNHKKTVDTIRVWLESNLLFIDTHLKGIFLI